VEIKCESITKQNLATLSLLHENLRLVFFVRHIQRCSKRRQCEDRPQDVPTDALACTQPLLVEIEHCLLANNNGAFRRPSGFRRITEVCIVIEQWVTLQTLLNLLQLF